MSWLVAAIVGHLLNAAAFIVDKTLLSSAFKRSGTYAAVIGLLSSTILVLLPLVNADQTLAVWVAIMIFGSVFIIAMWAFFEALSRAETSRVVPIVGSLVPVFTLIDSAIFVNERLAPRVLIGLAFLLAATVLLTRGGERKRRLDLTTLALCISAAFLFAASSVSGKYAFGHTAFMDAFVLSRVFSIVIALAIPLFIPAVREEIRSLVRPKPGQGPKPKHAALMFVGQACGALGFVGVQYAISLGSATVVNALQAVQYAAIVMVAWFGGARLATLLKEEHTQKAILLKVGAIALVGIGLVLVGLPIT